jgi:hypothetical protein
MAKKNSNSGGNAKAEPVAQATTVDEADAATLLAELGERIEAGEVAGQTIGHAGQDAALESVGIVLPESPRVYQVEIPNCLIGRRYVLASSEAEALEAYKRPSGIRTHEQAAIISVTPFDPQSLPEGVELFGA